MYFYDDEIDKINDNLEKHQEPTEELAEQAEEAEEEEQQSDSEEEVPETLDQGQGGGDNQFNLNRPEKSKNRRKS